MRFPALLLFISTIFCFCTRVCPPDDQAPDPYVFTFVDSSGNDRIKNGTIAIQDIKLQSLNGREQPYFFIENDLHHMLEIPELLESGEIHYLIQLTDSLEFTFYARAEMIRIDECRTRIEDNELNINGIDFLQDRYYARHFTILAQ